MRVKKGRYRIIQKKTSGEGRAIDSPVDAPVNWGEKIKTKEEKKKYKIKKKLEKIVSNSAFNSKNPISDKILKGVEKEQNPQLDWRKILSNYISKIEDDPTIYKIPNRRFISSDLYLPGLRGKEEGRGNIVVVIDTSCLICQDPNCNHGMSGQIFGPFLYELRGILSQFSGKYFYIIYSSDGVDGVQLLDDIKNPLDRNQMKSTGGNTNSFNPALEWVQKNIIDKDEDLDALIYFTDGFAPEPKKPYWSEKIIWAMISEKKMPFGKTINIPKESLRGDRFSGFLKNFGF
jgi:predicted metal-dependent peptidase